MCCQCGEHLQNSGEQGIHLCSGVHPVEDDVNSDKSGDETGETSEIKEEDLDERLGESSLIYDIYLFFCLLRNVTINNIL